MLRVGSRRPTPRFGAVSCGGPRLERLEGADFERAARLQAHRKEGRRAARARRAQLREALAQEHHLQRWTRAQAEGQNKRAAR
eukprot:3982510-Prymnesium_polylepis.1